MLIDCGSSSPGAGLRLIPQALRTLGATHVETVAITHADIRHFGALLDAAAPLGVRRVLVPAEFLRAAHRGLERPGLSSVSDRAAAALVSGLGRQRIEIVTLDRGDQWPIGGAVLRVLWPDEHGGSESLAHRAGPGVHSLVMRLSVTSESGGHSVLFTGGATAEALSALETMEPHLRADVLDLPDHGSYSDDAVRLIKRASARVLIRSGGNRVPADRLKERAHKDVPGAAWLDTATDGALRVEVLRIGTIRTHRFSDRGPSPP
jgi:beta-lactamase superfamily II metal-dependent hydrolase